MTTESTCRYCQRPIILADGRWVDPGATGDDSVWRETCDSHDTFEADHVAGGPDFEDFVRGYVDAMLWANTYAYDLDSVGEYGPELVTAEDALTDVRNGTFELDDAAAEALRNDCADFLTSQAVRLIRGAMRRGYRYQEYGFAGAGHDFALTRNSHGAGFWDRGFGIVGEALTKIAKPYGTRSLIVEGDQVSIFE